MNVMAPIFKRMSNAREGFIGELMEQFEYTEAQAAHILDVYRREHVVKLVPAMGRYDLVHGMFWERDILDRALTL